MGMWRSWTEHRDCWTCCPLGSETEVTQGHSPAATGEKSSQSIRHGSTKQPHRKCSCLEPEQTKLRAQLLLQLQRHLQAHLPLRKKLLWLLVQRLLSHHNPVKIQSLTWGGTGGNDSKSDLQMLDMAFKTASWAEHNSMMHKISLSGNITQLWGVKHRLGVFKWGRQMVWITGGPQDYP